MPEVIDVVRRRRRRKISSLSISARVGILLLALVPIVFGGGALAASRLYLELTHQVPAVEDINAFFDEAGLVPSVVADRHGEVITTLSNPGASERRWVGLSEQAAIPATELLVKALVAEQDPSFWENPGYFPGQRMAAIIAALTVDEPDVPHLTITEQLVEATLLPLDQFPPGSLRREFRRTLLAERLTNRYQKEQILEWYLNSAYFGEFIYGVDSASLTYFGKHANGLSLAEIAALVSLPGSDEVGMSSFARVQQRQNQVLNRLVEAGAISRRQADEAEQQQLTLRQVVEVRGFAEQPAVELAWEQAVDSYGDELELRGGLTYLTTLDLDVQQQAECLLETQIERLNGGTANVSVPARDGSPCLASGLLPPTRPSDVGVDRGIEAGSLALIDPEAGELRAYVEVSNSGQEEPPTRYAGELLQPYLYLTAFSRGFSPGSMVLDLPFTDVGTPMELDGQSLSGFEGPISMRQALRHGLRGAAADTLELAGYESYIRTLREVGLIEGDQAPEPAELVQGAVATDPILAAFAYGVLANDGVLVGYGNGSVEPKVLEQIEDWFGRQHPVAADQSRAILSQGLAFLINDVLLSDQQREDDPSQLSLGLDQPAAWISATEPNQAGAWTVAYSANASLAVWYGAGQGNSRSGLAPANSTNPAAAAILRYATRDEQIEIWERPLEVAEMDVCDPSGLLPTTYCPRVVSELFLQGTEPTSFDSLYQPFRLNRETGNLATLATPLELVEEKVFMVPPPRAAGWAQAVGLEQPPTEYDPLPAVNSGDEFVNIETPEAFAILRGEVLIEGDARPEAFDFYRVQAGAGLNPTQWLQIGEDRDRRIWNGTLANWDTEALSGLYTVQLVVVLEDGQIRTASVPVTIDNIAPTIELLQPAAGEVLHAGDYLQVEIAVEEMLGIELVELALDGRVIANLSEPPYSIRLEPLAAGSYELSIQATDRAGNQSEVISRTLIIRP